MTTYLQATDIESFHRDGYLVIPDFWDASTISALRTRAIEIVNANDLREVQSVFSTREQTRKSDDYFLTSGREIRFFWEEKADSSLKQSAPAEAINKIGHGLHDLDAVFHNVSYDGRIGSICRELGLERPLAVQSMYIFKQAKIGGYVCPHQDGTFLYTEPQSCIGFWWPLDDCSEENGCLYAVPGSHVLGVQRRFRRRDPPDNDSTEFVPVELPNWTEQLKDAVPLLISRGSLVILHSAVIHYSNENHSEYPRHAYSIHVVDGKEGVHYPKDNWLQRPEEHPFQEITAQWSATGTVMET
eukprot:gene24687-33159_t